MQNNRVQRNTQARFVLRTIDALCAQRTLRDLQNARNAARPRLRAGFAPERHGLPADRNGRVFSCERQKCRRCPSTILQIKPSNKLLALTRQVFLKWVKIFQEQRKLKGKEQAAEQVAEGTGAVSKDYREEVLAILMKLPPDGFERLAQRLLREAGFTQVTVTGQSGDGGIDGFGTLQVNPLVSFKVLFQCKRYAKSVPPSHVRDFRGAMAGRADKGIIVTTGTFTAEARREATRDGAPPIELIDGEKLLDMLEKLELGLKPVTTYEIEHSFFKEFVA